MVKVSSHIVTLVNVLRNFPILSHKFMSYYLITTSLVLCSIACLENINFRLIKSLMTCSLLLVLFFQYFINITTTLCTYVVILIFDQHKFSFLLFTLKLLLTNYPCSTLNSLFNTFTIFSTLFFYHCHQGITC